MTPAPRRPNRQPQHPPEEVPTPSDLAKALAHPLRRRILDLLDRVEEARSASELAQELQAPLTSVSYHMRKLRSFHALVQTDALPGRGSMEKFYASAVPDRGR